MTLPETPATALNLGPNPELPQPHEVATVTDLAHLIRTHAKRAEAHGLAACAYLAELDRRGWAGTQTELAAKLDMHPGTVRRMRAAARMLESLPADARRPTSIAQAARMAAELLPAPPKANKRRNLPNGDTMRAAARMTIPDHAQALHDGIDAGETQAITEAEAIARRIGWTPPGEPAPPARATRHQPAVRPTVQRPAPLPAPDGRQNGRKRQSEPRWK